MARAALQWSVAELARRSHVNVSMIRRIEEVFGPSKAKAEPLLALQHTFEAQGVRFIEDDGTPGGGPGVVYGGYPGRPVRRRNDLGSPPTL
jgi:transcriptional regulator with XRE-family HTH domain